MLLKYFGGKKERRNTKGERARAYYRGIKTSELNGKGGLGYQMTRRVKICTGYSFVLKQESCIAVCISQSRKLTSRSGMYSQHKS